MIGRRVPQRWSPLIGVPFAALALGGCISSAVHQLPPRDNTLASSAIVTTCPEPEDADDDSSSVLTGVRTDRRFLPVVVRPIPPPRPKPPFPRPPRPRPPFPPPPPPPPGPERKLHPLLTQWLANPQPGQRETLLVTFREHLRIPRFPMLRENEPRSSATNQVRLAQMKSLIVDIEARRDSAYDADSLVLARHGATVLHRHWLTHSLLVTMPIGRVRSLARERDVVYVQPRIGNEPPPTCPSTAPANAGSSDDPLTLQKKLQTDAFRNLALAYGYMSMLDTGVCTAHCLTDGAKLGVSGDCVNGGTDCQGSTLPGFSTTDQNAASGGHGTSSAALLVGDDSMGDDWKGALDITLDQFQVFSEGTCGTSGLCLNADAALHAFEESLDNGDRVILAELTSLAPDWAAVGMSAQNAFDAGAVILAANGNTGLAAYTVSSPASTPCVIGVGAWDVYWDATETSQSCGPTTYGARIKPDIQSPTGIETAELESSCAESSRLAVQNGTSGATPMAGAAAALIRNWMKATDDFVAPGHIYAGMILSGRHHGANLNNTEGAGRIELPTDGCAWWGLVALKEGFTESVDLDLSYFESDSLEVSLWWPEDLAIDASGLAIVQHNNVDVEIFAPGSSTAAVVGNQVESIFERVTAHVSSKGVWTLKLKGTDFYSTTAEQIVYWMAAARK